MDSKNDLYFVKRIIDDLEFIINHTKNKTIDEIKENELLVDSIMFRIIQISENDNRLSNTFKIENSSIPWAAIKGMRNKIVHDYAIINFEIVYDTIFVGIPRMYNTLLELLQQKTA
jgi:uncharacterized protein with HEPN domain